MQLIWWGEAPEDLSRQSKEIKPIAALSFTRSNRAPSRTHDTANTPGWSAGRSGDRQPSLAGRLSGGKADDTLRARLGARLGVSNDRTTACLVSLFDRLVLFGSLAPPNQPPNRATTDRQPPNPNPNTPLPGNVYRRRGCAGPLVLLRGWQPADPKPVGRALETGLLRKVRDALAGS